MRLLIKKITKSGKNEYEWIKNVEMVIALDDTKPRIQIDPDCCVRVPIMPKDIQKET